MEIKKAFVGFAGFGGVDLTLREFGFQVTGVEINDTIAEVNRVNGGQVITADILDLDSANFSNVDLAHFSPPCPRFSQARSKKATLDTSDRISDLATFQAVVNGESELDIKLSRKMCEFIRLVRPPYFTLENVWQYRKSLSWLNIWYTLQEQGYGVDTWNLNAADYGVPQSRRRMIVIARRDGRPPAKPFPTHAKEPDMFTNPWVGWYEAIEDLLPGLPETKPAAWQVARLPERLKTALVMTGNNALADAKPGKGWLACEMPANTVMAQSAMGKAKAFILGQGERSKPKNGGCPVGTITANNNQTGIKAFVIETQNTSHNLTTCKMSGDPIFTINANVFEKNAAQKAFIIGDEFNNWGDRTVMNREGNTPIWTISANEKLSGLKMWQGRWLSMTARCLARFQDFPDWFELPESRELACRGIGNALPSGLYRAVLRSLGMSS